MSGDDQNSWNHQVMKNKDKPLFSDVSLNGVQSAHLTFECNICLQRFVWIDHMPFLLTGAKESKGTKTTNTGKTFPITIYSLTGNQHERNCEPPKDLLKRGEPPTDKPSSSPSPSIKPPPTSAPITPSPPSKPADFKKASDFSPQDEFIISIARLNTNVEILLELHVQTNELLKQLVKGAK